MPTIEISTTRTSGFCHSAKRLLGSKNQSFAEIDVSTDSDKRQEMMARANGGYTVPQIFINGTHVGGCDDLYALERSGKLDPMLEG